MINKHTKKHSQSADHIFHNNPYLNLHSYLNTNSGGWKETILNEKTRLDKIQNVERNGNENQRIEDQTLDNSFFENSFLLIEQMSKIENQQELFEQWLCRSKI